MDEKNMQLQCDIQNAVQTRNLRVIMLLCQENN